MYLVKYGLLGILCILAVLFVILSTILLAWPLLAVIAAKYFS